MLFGMSVAILDFIVLTSPVGVIGLIHLPPSESADGIDPDGLIRTPSTSSIA